MARSYASIKASIWTDPDWRALTPDAQRLYLLLLSQPEITNCGMVPYVPTRWNNMAAGGTVEQLEDALHELEHARFVIVDRDTCEVLIRSFIRHDVVEKQPRILQAAHRQYQELQSVEIRRALADEYPHLFTLNPHETTENQPLSKPLPKGVSEGVSEPLGEPLRVRARAASGNRQPATSSNARTRANPAAADLQILAAAGWTPRQLDAAATDPTRAIALLNHHQADPTCRNPAGLAWQQFNAGHPAPTTRTPKTTDAETAWRKYLDGHGWDETYDANLILEELDRLQSRSTITNPISHATALDMWLAERSTRWPGIDDEEPGPSTIRRPTKETPPRREAA